jgi:hypothetical protein
LKSWKSSRWLLFGVLEVLIMLFCVLEVIIMLFGVWSVVLCAKLLSKLY